MKVLRRLAVAVIATMAVMAMAIPAFADNVEETYSITIKNAAEGHTYEAYQIFSGDFHNGKLSNIQWGSGVDETAKAGLGSAAEQAALLNDGNITEFAKEMGGYLTKEAVPSTSVQSDGKYVIEGLPAGYYLIKDMDGSLAGKQDAAYTEFIVRVVGDVEANAKASIPEVQKKVRDADDTAGTETDWQDSADYDIGDAVPFKLEANLAANLVSYTTYKVVFHDTMSPGLEFVKITRATLDGHAINVTNDMVSASKNGKGETELTITFNDVKALGAVNGSELIVEYEATLDADAVLGAAGNSNVVYLEYSNNPNGEGTGETVKDEVTVYTYKVSVNKVDGDLKPLPGAEFALYKNVGGMWELVDGKLTVSEDGTAFAWTGLDDGDYKLCETVTPQGYNTIADILFTISAGHSLSSDDPELTTLRGGDRFTGEVSTGIVKSQIINQSGAVLPSTGGMGTTILYGAGIALVLVAGVALVVRKRSRSN